MRQQLHCIIPFAGYRDGTIHLVHAIHILWPICSIQSIFCYSQNTMLFKVYLKFRVDLILRRDFACFQTH